MGLTEGDAGNIPTLLTNNLSMYQARLPTSSNPLSSENMVSSNLPSHTDYLLTLAENPLDPLSELQFSDAAFNARETAVNSSRHTLDRGYDRTFNKNKNVETEPEPEPHWIEEFMLSGLGDGPQPWGTL
jgi:hypothetical protein